MKGWVTGAGSAAWRGGALDKRFTQVGSSFWLTDVSCLLINLYLLRGVLRLGRAFVILVLKASAVGETLGPTRGVSQSGLGGILLIGQIKVFRATTLLGPYTSSAVFWLLLVWVFLSLKLWMVASIRGRYI